MVALTSRQRDILRVLCEANRSLNAAEIASAVHLTPRQVNYCLRDLRVWLKQRDHTLLRTPRSGFSIPLTAAQARQILVELHRPTSTAMVLSVSQRQQLLALFLLTQSEPVIVRQLEQLAQMSRLTLLKDLDLIEGWLSTGPLELVRKQHFGVQVRGAEQSRQRALAQLLWGETPLSGDGFVALSHADGLVFHLQQDAAMLPLIAYAATWLSHIQLRPALDWVARAEAQLGGRFTDDAMLHLAVMLGILAHRVQSRQHRQIEPPALAELQALPVWPPAAFVARSLDRARRSTWTPADIAGLAMELAAAPRSESHPSALEPRADFDRLIDRLVEKASDALQNDKLKQDHTLRSGLVNNLVPACYRQRFQLWFPEALNTSNLPGHVEREMVLARELAGLVREHTGISLPESEVVNLAVLLHAAYIRNQAYRFERVIVICPSGMATAQLLVARIRARFPHLGTLEVFSLRDLTPELEAAADLILTTVPLPRPFKDSPKVLRVHPVLRPEDIEAVTQFLS